MQQENPFYYNLPTRPEDFVGRWSLVNSIVEDLCRPRPDSWAVIGGKRFGKSSVLKMIEAQLTERLEACSVGDRRIFPCLVDLKRCNPASAQHIYACILRYLYRALQRDWAWKDNLKATEIHRITAEDQDLDYISFFQFEDALEGLSRHLDSYQHPFRLVLLLDEIEAMIGEDWSETLFNQIRSIIYDGFLANIVKVVLTGSANVIRARQSGSPLLNAVKIEHLALLDADDLQFLIARGGEVPLDVAAAVQVESGGHPFVAQYLLHHAWDHGLAHVTSHTIDKIACKLRQSRDDLEGWWQAIGDSGQWAYAILATDEDWLDERVLIEKIQHTEQSLDHGLSALCYHGLVRRDKSRHRYRIAGKLFFDWFTLNGAERLKASSSRSKEAQVIIERIEQHISAQTNIAGHAKGPIASGEFNSATTFGDGDAEDNRRNTASEKGSEGG